MIKSVEVKISAKSFLVFTKGKNGVRSIKEFMGRVTVHIKNKKEDKKLSYKGYPYSVVK